MAMFVEFVESVEFVSEVFFFLEFSTATFFEPDLSAAFAESIETNTENAEIGVIKVAKRQSKMVFDVAALNMCQV